MYRLKPLALFVGLLLTVGALLGFVAIQVGTRLQHPELTETQLWSWTVGPHVDCLAALAAGFGLAHWGNRE